jgi:hypothetical protein
MNLNWYDLVGSVGVSTIILTYFLLQTNRIDSKSFLYSLLNGAGAGLVIVSLVFEFNFAAFMVEAFWVLISLLGIWKYFKNR